MRSMYKGVLGFGLVSIPVELYRAVGADRVETHLIHRECGERVRYQKVCPVCDRVLGQQDIVRAAVLEDGRLVPLDEADGTEDAPADPDRSIDILTFHPLSEVDPVYFDAAYWLRPQRGGAKAYRLLWDAMRRRDRVAVAKMAARGRPHLSVVRPYPAGAMMLHRMHWPENLRREGAHFGEAPHGPISDREEQLALSLVDQLSEQFRPEAYPDEARADLMERLYRRAEEGDFVEVDPKETPGVRDLVDQLAASLSALPGGAAGAR
jgi:DNA end-binding protein Ku